MSALKLTAHKALRRHSLATMETLAALAASAAIDSGLPAQDAPPK